MGLRFRKSIKIIPGVRLNLNKNSHSWTFGTKNYHHTINSNGKQTTSVNLPGGFSYINTKKNSNNSNMNNPLNSNQYELFALLLGIVSFLTGLFLLGAIFGIAGIVFAIKSFKLVGRKCPNTIGLILSVIGILMSLLMWSSLNSPPDSSTVVPTTEITTETITEEPTHTTSEKITEYITETTIETTTEATVEMVWISSNGKKYHSRSSCSNMENPEKVPINEVEKKGYTPCKRCH